MGQRGAVAIMTTAVALVLALGAGPTSAAETQEFELGRASWPEAEVLERCHAVLETAQAGYEGISAVASITGDTLRFVMTSDVDFPVVMLEAKLCTWIDADGDSMIDPGEESTVLASIGPFDWPEGTHVATATARLDAGDGRVCSRMWFYASYVDGNLGTKRSSIACVDRNVVPPASVPDAAHVALLGVTGGVVFGVAALGARRRRLAR